MNLQSILSFGVLGLLVVAGCAGNRHLTVQTATKSIRLNHEQWRPLKNETETARNFEARTRKPSQVYSTVITVYLLPMSADRALGKKLTDTEFLEIFSVHPGTVTVQLRVKKDGYWILSRETLKMPEPALVDVRQYKPSFTDDEVSLMHRQLQNDIDETRAFVRTEL